MFNSPILDVAIGLLFVFILVSTISAAIREALESWLKTRAIYLEYAIRELFGGKDGLQLTKTFFDHPLIGGLFQGTYTQKTEMSKRSLWRLGKNMPSYIPSRSFALAVMDLAVRGPMRTPGEAQSGPSAVELTLQRVRENVHTLNSPLVERAVLVALDTSRGELEKAVQNIEHWYDAAMERVSGWYKRSTQWLLLGIASVVVVALNINTVRIAEHLYRDQALRNTLVAAASSSSSGMTYQQARASVDELNLPIGWSDGWNWHKTQADSHQAEPKLEVWNDFVAPILGLLITALAATLGAPFWFDVLSKVMVVRATVKPRERKRTTDDVSADDPPARPTPGELLLPHIQMFASAQAAPASKPVSEQHSSSPPALPSRAAAASGYPVNQ